MITVADLGGIGRLMYGAVLLSALSTGWLYVNHLRHQAQRRFKL